MLLCGAPLSNSLLTHWIRLKDLAYLWMTCRGGVEVHNVDVLLRRVRIDFWENRKIITHSSKECLYQKLHSWTTVVRKNIDTESKKVAIWIEPMCCNTSYSTLFSTKLAYIYDVARSASPNYCIYQNVRQNTDYVWKSGCCTIFDIYIFTKAGVLLKCTGPCIFVLVFKQI